ncbi:MAG: hypothetical protein ACK4RZ_02265 [Paracoccaceae bacterium]
MPLRKALRGLRFLLRRGGETLVDTLVIEALPKPAATLVSKALRDVGELAQGAEKIASGFAKAVLGGHEEGPVILDDLGGDLHADAQFAAWVYAALRSVLLRLGVPGVFVSEAAARSAYRLAPTVDAATLTLNLLDARVVRGTSAHEVAVVPGSALEAVAIFAVMLWLQSTRSEDESEDALDAAADLAIAIAPEVDAACVARDHNRIATLYGRYVAHV